MPRSKHAVPSRQRRRRILNSAKGYWGRRKSALRSAKEAIDRALQYAYRDRRQRRRELRRLWITRINAAARLADMNYSTFMAALTTKNVEIDRKTLADLAVRDQEAFNKLVEFAKK